MSTRCNIIIKDRRHRVILYHHHDGYPEGVGSDLKKYLSKFEDWQIRQHGRWEIANDLVKDKAGLNDDGYEVTMALHTDIDYCYVINCVSGTLLCYSCSRLGYSYDTGRYTWDLVFRKENLRDIPDREPEEVGEEIIVKRNDRFEAALSDMLDEAVRCFCSGDGLNHKEFVESHAPGLLDIAKGPFYYHIIKK